MRRKSLTGPAIKSLIFVLVTALATTALAFSIANTGVGDTDGYVARFTDATGLLEGDSVRVAGVKVGEVESIKVVDRRFAEVRFAVREGRTLPATSEASIKYLNMVGQRYIDLEQGTGPVNAGSLAVGDTIPLSRTQPALDLTQLFNGFQPLFQGLSPKDTNKLANEIVRVLQGEGSTVNSLVETVGSLTTTLARKDEVIGNVVKNLNTVLGTINTREEHFDELVGTLTDLVSGFASDREPIGEAISAMGELTVSTAGLVDEAREPLKEDIHQLGRVTDVLAENTPLIENFLKKTPVKMRELTRLNSYGSWLNFYLCEAKVSGVSTYDGSEAPTGIAVTQPRCRR